MARATAQKKAVDTQSIMEVFRKLATPGAPHKLLAVLAGTWDVRCTCWMEPGKPPNEHTGVSEQKMVLGERFLQQEFSGELKGSPFTGIGFTGYINHIK
jgi:hypothetical protein